MTDRIRWERIDGTVTSWFGYVGSHKTPMFQILHPVASKPDARTQFHKWALAATFAQDEVRYPETAEGAQSALKDEAEKWLGEFTASLGAVFPDEPRAMFADVTDEETLRAQFAPGGYVRYAHPDAGYPGEQDEAREILVLGALYGIARSDIGQSRTDLSLVGIEGRFNSVLFEPVTPATSAPVAQDKET